MDLLTAVLALLLGLALGLLAGRLLARRDEQLLLTSFEGLAARALAGTREDAERDLDLQRDAVAHLVEPLREQLGRVEGQLRGVEVERARAFAELREQVSSVRATSERLGDETSALVSALRKPQARGQWGEMQLRRVVEHAGMLARCDFDEQASVRDAEGRALRPDLVVRLAGGRTVVADETYLRESILNPSARLVEGYQPIMPTFQGLISEEGLLQLVAYIKTLSKPGPAAGTGIAVPANRAEPPKKEDAR